MLGSEHWEKNFKSLLFLVTEYIVDVLEVRKQIYCMAMMHAPVIFSLSPRLAFRSGGSKVIR